MIAVPPNDRPELRVDLTRWNRAGRGRFDYVDGDAATWLEEMRIALLGLYLRRAPGDLRLPGAWREFFSSDLFELGGDAIKKAERLAALTERRRHEPSWSRLSTEFPERRETVMLRNARLLAQYEASPTDYGWEIVRAFARAAHVLLGHLDAYANEGYLRTATQWDNVRRLAAMVNYQPAPPASATTDVALLVDPALGPTEVDRGLAMKFVPPTGGAPLVFETLRPVLAHPDLNAARAVGWDRDERPLRLRGAVTWVVPKRVALAPGDLAVVVDAASEAGEAVVMGDVTVNEVAGTADITCSPTPGHAYRAVDATLCVEPTQTLIGQPRSSAGILSVVVDEIARFTIGGLVFIDATTTTGLGQVLSTEDRTLRMTVDSGLNATGEVRLSPMTPVAVREVDSRTVDESTRVGRAVVGTADRVVFGTANGLVEVARTDASVAFPDTGVWRFPAPDQAETGYVHNAVFVAGAVVREPPGVVAGRAPAPTKTVRFIGKPPKGLEAGSWFAARSPSGLEGLRVVGVRTEPDGFYLEFHAGVAAPEATEFHGPMRRCLRPLHADRSHRPAIVDDAVILTGISDAAREMIRPRRGVFVERDRDGVREVGRAVVLEAVAIEEGLRLTLAPTRGMRRWEAGWVRFLINTVEVSHGETKGSKALGSGDAEVPRQSFALDAKEIAFVPSTAAESGVTPDLDVVVDGAVWPYRDLVDPTAEGTRAWSYVQGEDGGLAIRFRQRLVTGTDNVRVARHRIGVGRKGSGVPPFSFDKPSKAHRHVTGIVQPFATEGGADREPVSSLRENAPACIAANDRAVSLVDFESLTRRHASVRRARASHVVRAGGPGVRVVVVPASGGGIAGIEADLAAYVRSRALPGVDVTFVAYEDFPVAVSARIWIDRRAYDRDRVQEAAAAALKTAFRLEERGIGQPFYVAEVMAVLEAVAGVSATTVSAFGPAAGAPPTGGRGRARLSTTGGSIVAIFPTGEQVARLASVSLTPESTP